MTHTLHGKTALVTGASKGIGRAAALRLARDGAFVFVNYASDKKGADEAVAAIEKAGGKALALHGDIRTVEAIRTLFFTIDDVLKERGFKHLDILVNNAGVYQMGDLEQTTEAMFDTMFSINVKGLFFVTQEAQKRMGAGGRIINISSAVTRVGSHSMLAYAATKGAVDIITRDTAIALGGKGITVNAINPGLIRTEGTGFLFSAPDTESFFSKASVLGRVGEATDIADAIAFFASDDSRWVTAQCVEVSGGYHL